MKNYRVRIVVEIRNGDGNFLQVFPGDSIPFEPGHMLAACSVSFDTALQKQKAEVEHHPGHD